MTGATQIELYQAIQNLTIGKSIWFLRNVVFDSGIGPIADGYGRSVAAIDGMLDRLLPEQLAGRVSEAVDRYRAAGVPDRLARSIAHLPVLADATDIHLVAEATGEPLEKAAAVFYAIGERFRNRRGDAPRHDHSGERLL